jgi:hypothetical protein
MSLADDLRREDHQLRARLMQRYLRTLGPLSMRDAQRAHEALERIQAQWADLEVAAWDSPAELN